MDIDIGIDVGTRTGLVDSGVGPRRRRQHRAQEIIVVVPRLVALHGVEGGEKRLEKQKREVGKFRRIRRRVETNAVLGVPCDV